MKKMMIGLMLIVSLYAESTIEKENKERELRLYEKQCQEGNATACYKAGVKYTNQATIEGRATAFTFFHKSCDLNDTYVCTKLARTYESNLSTRYDINKSIGLYKKSCLLKDAKACEGLGFIYEEGRGEVAPDHDLAVKYFMKTCEFSTDSCKKIAFAYDFGVNGLHKERSSAIVFYKKACDYNITTSCSSLGRFYLEDKKYVDASLVLKKSCQSKDGWSCSQLGELYAVGAKKMVKDNNKSVSFYDKACNYGSRTSCSKLGRMYLNNKKVTKALGYLQKACERADAEACRTLGLIHENGREEIKKNKFKSLKFFSQACNFGDESSCKL